MKGLIATPKMDAIVAFKLPTEDRDKLEEMASKSGVTASHFMRYALKKAISQAEKHNLAG